MVTNGTKLDLFLTIDGNIYIFDGIDTYVASLIIHIVDNLTDVYDYDLCYSKNGKILNNCDLRKVLDYSI